MNKNIPTHAVKAVVKNKEGDILFLRRKTDPSRLVISNWDLPGGLVEEGEEDAFALQREILEELGVEATISEELGKWTFHRPFDGNTVKVTNYLVTLSDIDFTLSSEHMDYAWVTFDAAKKLPVKDQSLFGALGE